MLTFAIREKMKPGLMCRPVCLSKRECSRMLSYSRSGDSSRPKPMEKYKTVGDQVHSARTPVAFQQTLGRDSAEAGTSALCAFTTYAMRPSKFSFPRSHGIAAFKRMALSPCPHSRHCNHCSPTNNPELVYSGFVGQCRLSSNSLEKSSDV